MSIMHFDATTALSERVEVTLSGGFSNDFDSFTAQGGFTWDNDGSVYNRANGGKSIIHADTDWIRPTTGLVPGDYQIRWHLTSLASRGGTTTLINGAEFQDNFQSLSSDRSVIYEHQPFIGEFGVPYITIDEGVSILILVEIRHIEPAKNPITSTLDSEPIIVAQPFYQINLNGIA